VILSFQARGANADIGDSLRRSVCSRIKVEKTVDIHSPAHISESFAKPQRRALQSHSASYMYVRLTTYSDNVVHCTYI
jgi:hypothetical protein